MRWLPVLAILFVSSPAVAQDPVKVDPAHHKVEIDNSQVRVLRVTLGPNEKTTVAEHPASAAIFLTEGKQRVGPGGNDTRKPGDAVMLAAGKHVFENLGNARAEIVVIEFKTPPITPWKAVALDPVKVDPGNFKVIAESDYAQILRGTAKPPKIEHEHGAYLFVWLSGGTLARGAVQYRAGPEKHAPQNDGEAIMVELKTQPGAPAAKQEHGT